MWNVSVKLLKYIFNRNIRQVTDCYWFIGSWSVITDRNIDRIYIFIKTRLQASACIII